MATRRIARNRFITVIAILGAVIPFAKEKRKFRRLFLEPREK
jgi:hypothetical protein